MEMRGHDKDMGMPNSNSSALNQDNNREFSSSKLSTSPLNSNLGGRREETTISPLRNLDRQHLYPAPHFLSSLQQQAQRPRGDPEQTPDLGSAKATNSGAAGIQIGSRPQVRPPPYIRQAGTAAPTVRYRECLKNHAASMGTHVLDGCGEFMPSGEEGTPEALKCAACDCHRNFHRKEVDGESQYAANYYSMLNPNRNGRRSDATAPPQLPVAIQTQNSLQQHQRYSNGLSISPSTAQVPKMMMAFGGNGGALGESSSEDLNMHQVIGGQPPIAKKRVRTKFTQEQKDKMMEFCEKLGWKIQKQDKEIIQQFCSEVGVRRQALKVWMHNNKQAMKRATVRHNY